MQQILQILGVTAIALGCGIIIYICFVRIPTKVKGIEKTLELAAMLPGRNCAACGQPGCFGYAQALSADPETIRKAPCAFMVQDEARLAALGEAIGISLDASAMDKRALCHCFSNSEVVYHYSGVMTCKSAAQLLSGNKKCPYACLGFGDCVAVCPQNAITLDPERKVPVIDWTKCSGCGLCVTECAKGIIELVSPETKIAFRCSYIPLRPIPGRERCALGCTHCQRCFRACEFGAITWNKEKAIPEFDHEKCTLCLKCIQECPQNTLARVAQEEGVPEKVAA